MDDATAGLESHATPQLCSAFSCPAPVLRVWRLQTSHLISGQDEDDFQLPWHSKVMGVMIFGLHSQSRGYFVPPSRVTCTTWALTNFAQ